MTDVVLDASVALSWVLSDEGNRSTLRLRELAKSKPQMVLLVPPNFWFEVANVLWVAVRRGRLREDAAMGALDALEEFGIDVWVTEPRRCLALSFKHQLAVYDCAYLSIALQRGSTLWTLDSSLAKATREAGLTVAP